MPGVTSSTHANSCVLHDKPQNRHDNPVLLEERRVNQPGIPSCLHLEWTKNHECKRARPLTLLSTSSYIVKNKWTCYSKVWKIPGVWLENLFCCDSKSLMVNNEKHNTIIFKKLDWWSRSDIKLTSRKRRRGGRQKQRSEDTESTILFSWE